jgi:flagellar FliL protein
MIKRLLPVIVILLVGGVAFIGGKIMGGKAASGAEPPVNEKKHKKKHKAADEPLPVHELKEFIVNLADAEPPHFAKFTIAIELEEEIHNEEEWKKYEPPIRDAVLSIATTKHYNDLLTLKGKTALKKAILEKVQEIMGEDKASGVYLTDFAMQ